MRLVLEKYYRVFLLGVVNSVEYQKDFYLSLLSAVFPLVIQYFLWTAIFEQSPSDVVYGYTYGQILLYSCLAGIIGKALAVGFEYEITEEIRTGSFNKYIVWPISFFSYRFAAYLGTKFVYLLLSLLIIGAVLGGFVSYFQWDVQLSQWGLFLGSFILAILLNFLIFYGVASIAFWLVDISFFFEGVKIVILIVSGGLLPLDIFGPGLQTFFKLLPFQYTIYFPVNVLTNRLSFNEILLGLLSQVGWIIVMFFLVRLSWKVGLKQYVAVGG